ncbi:hypothetical protein FRC08_008009 [Ceratobasidium sp. 394]|nr:hypothetical protein FRC08_008009 [Ceratobasidium sp. 394]
MGMTLTPPILPSFLAVTYDLKPVEGTPSDAEAKLVHAVIRALNGVVDVPVLYDADLAMCLSMHLFSIQMARYRDKHPCVVFPSNITHTPPQLPAHIPVELGPVTGPPSDSKFKSVQNALRLSENMASVPSMFDADLSMNLSQHLFNIQFERYLRQVADGNPSAPATIPQAGDVNMNNSDTADPPGVHNGIPESNREHGDRDALTIETAGLESTQESPAVCPRDHASKLSVATRNTIELLEPIRTESNQDFAPLLKIGLDDTNKLLADLKQVLIGTQQSMARGLNRTSRSTDTWQCTHTLLNRNGEEPHNLVPSLRTLQYNLIYGNQVQSSDVARLLRFYGLGREFIEEGDNPAIKEGKIDAARAELRSFFGF